MQNKMILDTAFRVWEADFYQRASLSLLACELGVTKPALYRHFKNKEMLLKAMADILFEGMAAALKPDFEDYLTIRDTLTQRIKMIRSIAGYFLHNRHYFIFWIAHVYGALCESRLDWKAELKKRGVNLDLLLTPVQETEKQTDSIQRSGFQMIGSTMFFMLLFFYRQNRGQNRRPGNELVSLFLDTIELQIRYGLKLPVEQSAAFDFERLEAAVQNCPLPQAEDDIHAKLLAAVTQAVGEAGLWRVSMGQIAKKMGVSKSALYSHFPGKSQMVLELITNEIAHTVNYTRRCSLLAAVPEERLYLAITGITRYLWEKRDVLLMIDKLRMHQAGLHEDFFQKKYDCDSEYLLIGQVHALFSEIKKPDGSLLVNERDTEWILFLIINILLSLPQKGNENNIREHLNYKDIRTLFQFITEGIEGTTIAKQGEL